LRRYQGDIAVESRPGRTEFRVTLTADDGSAGRERAPGEVGGR
jgi:nitrogen-specific signal transduction histidine kinase